MRMTLFAHKNSVGPRCFSFALLAFLLCGLSLLNLTGAGFASPATNHIEHHKAIPVSYTISGSTYDDYNQNGTQDAREPGLNGVVVTAYDANNTVVATSTSTTS